MNVHVNDLATAVKTTCRHIKLLYKKQLQAITVKDYRQWIIHRKTGKYDFMKKAKTLFQLCSESVWIGYIS